MPMLSETKPKKLVGKPQRLQLSTGGGVWISAEAEMKLKKWKLTWNYKKDLNFF